MNNIWERGWVVEAKSDPEPIITINFRQLGDPPDFKRVASRAKQPWMV